MERSIPLFFTIFRIAALTRTNMSSSFLRRFSSFSISVWHVWQTYKWLTAGPPPYLINSQQWECNNNQRFKNPYSSIKLIPAIQKIPYVLRKHHNEIINGRCFVWWNTCQEAEARWLYNNILSLIIMKSCFNRWSSIRSYPLQIHDISTSSNDSDQGKENVFLKRFTKKK